MAYPPDQTTPSEAVIPPRGEARVRKAKRRYRPSEAGNQRVEDLDRGGRKTWQRQRGAHRRSLSESGLSRFKRLLGPPLRARKLPGHQVEARSGCRILNRMIHLGKPETYRVEVAA